MKSYEKIKSGSGSGSGSKAGAAIGEESLFLVSGRKSRGGVGG